MAEIIIFKHKYFHRTVLGLFLILFISLKWASLSLPYFWDEAWSYIPAISEMAKTKPGLLPACIGIESYRGHPLLFYFLASLWMKFAGSSLFSMHLFALLISILAIISFYRLALIPLPSIWALFCGLVLMLQEVFYVQSSFVLPEVLIMLLTTESIFCYLKGRKLYFLLCAGLLGLTKEIGIVILFGFIIYHIIKIKGIKKEAYWIYLSVLPALVFYVLQKIQLGWFFYPLHVNLIDVSFNTIKLKLGIILKFILIEQGRMALLIILNTLLVFRMMTRDFKKNTVPIIAFITLITGLIIAQNIFTILLLLGFLLYYGIKSFEYTAYEKHLLSLMGIISLLVISFSTINFLMLRYLMIFIPFLILYTSILANKMLSNRLIHFVIFSLVLGLNFIYTFIYNIRTTLWHDDVSLNYLNMVKVHQEVIQFCEQQNWHDKTIFTHFLLQQDLVNSDLGYLSNNVPFKNALYEGEISEKDEIVIFSCIELDDSKYMAVKSNPGYRLRERFEEHKAWSAIYVLQDTTSFTK